MLQLINAKLGVLKLGAKSSELRSEDGICNPREVERMTSQIEGKLNEICQLKQVILEQKLIDGEDISEVESWDSDLESEMKPYKETLNDLYELSANLTISDERRLRERNQKVSSEYDEKRSQSKSNLMRVKLPKLEISRFNGSPTDFTRFWNTFSEEIDRSELPGTSKFSYLKEYLGPKVRPLIESLPFNIEGYTRAKTILESRYGRTSEIVTAHIQKIMNLQTVNGTNPTKVNEFYETLLKNVQALETMGKLESVNGYVRMVLDRLPGIRSELVRDDDDWHEWKFPDLVESLRKWTERNPVLITDRNQREESNNDRRHGGRDRVYQTGDRNSNSGVGTDCVYCDSKAHKSFQCDVVSSSGARKKVLSEKKLCFNCTGSQHQAGRCKSKKNCGKCNGRHHTSICDDTEQPPEPSPPSDGSTRQPLLVSKESSVVYPAVIVQVNGVKCRAVLDTMAGSSYVSAGLLDYIGAKDFRTTTRAIEMMFQTVKKKINIYNLTIQNSEGTPIFESEFTKVDRKELLHLPNPNYEKLKKQYRHLSAVTMDDTDTKAELPIHIIFGTNAYTHVKTATAPLVGAPGEPVAEFTRLGWTIMSSGRGDDVTSTFLTRSLSEEYEQLCSLDVLGVQDTPDGDQSAVYDNFCEQLVQKEDGRYETGLLWKPNHSALANNKEGSRARLANLIRKHKHSNFKLLEDYDAVIREQIADEMVEVVPPDADDPGEKEFYIPHKPVIREQAQSTKMRIVFDASARANERSPSLNDCLETGPPLQNLMWDVLLRSRFHPIIVAGDMKQAFLQISIREADRDALRFHWVKDLKNFEPITLRFARALFGLNQSPFLLGAVVREHLKKFAAKYPELVREIILCLYVDDLIHGTFSVEKGKRFKELSTEIFTEGKFTLHKWQSNVPMLEDQKPTVDDDETTFAKQKLDAETQTKLLGMPWDKVDDTISVRIPETNNVGETKRCILIFLAAIFDLLGFICPVVLRGKHIYRQACESKFGWDTQLTGEVLNSWKHFIKHLPQIATVRRPLAPYRESIKHVDLHLFTDASKIGTAAVVYTIVTQASGVTQALAAAKSRLSKKATIPRLELTAALLGANLLNNVRDVLQKIGTGVPIRRAIGWSDSTTALHWISGHGNHQYKQFVSNHCEKITSKLAEWRHVPGLENPADIASRGAKFCELDDKWWYGPDWLNDETKWPEKVITNSTADTEVEAKLVKEVLRVTVPSESDHLSPLMDKFSFKKAIRVTGWILRFVQNCKQKEGLSGPLSTDEIHAATDVWIRRAQREAETDSKFEKHLSQLNLKKNAAGIYVCMGRIQGHYPVYLPTYSIISEKVVANSHLATLHGGVGLTMAHVREHYWIPRLRQLAKKLRKGCFGCKRMHATPLHPPPPGMLPPERTVGSRPFEVIGLDYAGPFPYKVSKKKEGKAYLMLYTCSLTRAVHLELLPDQTAKTFVPSLKAMIARRGRPKRIYSDNFSTFISSAKWLKRVVKNEETHDFLASNEIQWRFNLSRAPWWGGQFERMVGIVKDSLYKSIGKSVLSWNELSEVLLDVEICINNRPLSYVDDDVQMPLLTPNVMMFGEGFRTPEEDVDNIEDKDLRKRARYLLRCKERVWSRWHSEYLRGLRERHNMTHSGKTNSMAIGDVMLIKGDERNRAKWKIGIVKELITGVDGVVRGAILRAGRDHLERAVQFLYPLELHCDRETEPKPYKLNPTVEAFRPKRKAATVSQQRTKGVIELENGCPAVDI